MDLSALRAVQTMGIAESFARYIDTIIKKAQRGEKLAPHEQALIISAGMTILAGK